LRTPVIKKERGGADFEGALKLHSESEIGEETRKNLFLSIYEGEFVVKTIYDEAEKRQAHYLRYQIFSQQLKWTKENPERMERDEYDEGAIFLGVFGKEKRLAAFLRLLPPEKPFMLEKVFSMLVGADHVIRHLDDTAEISRLCVASDARHGTISCSFGVNGITLLLYKGVYHWCMGNAIRYLYLVVEPKLLRFLKIKGYPCRSIGPTKIMPDGVSAVAAMMDWREFETLSAVRNPKMLEWFIQYQQPPFEQQSPPSAADLQLQIFA
jgi:acyl homoserine lactone synthase